MLVVQTEQLTALNCHHLTACCHLATMVVHADEESQLGKARVTPVYTLVSLSIVFWSYMVIGLCWSHSPHALQCTPCDLESNG